MGPASSRRMSMRRRTRRPRRRGRQWRRERENGGGDGAREPPGRGLAKADEAAVGEYDEAVAGDPEQRDRHERREHERDVEEAAPGEVDEDAETTIGACPLPDDRADDGEGRADAESTQDRRQGGRDLDVEENAPW